MVRINRMVCYFWYVFIMWITSFWGDINLCNRIRGFLLKPAFKKCGKNFQIASGVKIGWTSSVEIGNDVFIANYCWIQGKGRVVLEDEVMIGPFTCLASNRHGRTGHSWRYGIGSCAPIVLKKGSWTGAHVVVTAGVTIGEGAVVAAGAVVTSDILSDTVSGGVPAKVIKSLT